MRFDQLPMKVQQELFLWRAVALIIVPGGIGFGFGWMLWAA